MVSMLDKKYELTDETLDYYGHTLYRIKRVSNNEIGGWVESEENLSQTGDCWIAFKAKVLEGARVTDNAFVGSRFTVKGGAIISGSA